MGENFGYKAGFLPLMLAEYDVIDPQIRVKLGKMAKMIIGGLRECGIEVEAAELAACAGEIEAACGQLAGSGADLLVVSHMCYAPSGVIAPALLETELPIVLWPGQSMYELRAEAYDYATIIENHGLHGTQDLANVLRRRGKRFGVVHGHYCQREFQEELMVWLKAGRMIQAMQRSNPMVLGGHFVNMLDLQLDGEEFLAELPVAAEEISLDDFVGVSQAITEEAIANRMREGSEVFAGVDAVDKTIWAQGIRHELALQQVLAAKGSRALGINFLPLCAAPAIRDAMHWAASVLMSEGAGYGAEGDWVTGMLMHGLQRVTGGVSFTEIFSAGFKDNRLVLKHWGEGNYGLARSKPSLSVSECGTANGPVRFVVVDFEYRPCAEATLVNLNVSRESRGQIISIGGSIEGDSLSQTGGPRGIFRPHCPDVRKVLTDYALAGGSHHLVLVTEDCGALLDKVCLLLGWERIRM